MLNQSSYSVWVGSVGPILTVKMYRIALFPEIQSMCFKILEVHNNFLLTRDK